METRSVAGLRSRAVARILLIDDDRALLDVLSLAFEDGGHSVITAQDGAEGLARIRADSPDLVVCDINLPRLDGFSLARQVREAQNRVPLILLTSRDNEIDEALGLELGADDYVSKPFSTRVLLARIAALLRREAARGASQAPEQRLSSGRMVLDLERLAAEFGGRPLELTLTEFRLLETLIHRPGVVFSRDQLLERARGDDSVVADRLIDTYVRRLRRKLEAIDPAFDEIETVIGAGYRWKSDGR
jgi:DNA-binding response OmpR family regulator